MISGLTVFVSDNNVERALRKLKKKVNDSKRLVDYCAKEEYVKPTTKRKLKAAQGKARWRKKLRDSELPKSSF